MPSLEEVKNYLRARQVEVLEFDQPTPCSASAAQAVGCSAAEIAKSLLFIVGGEPVLVVTSGDTRVKSSLLKQALGRSGKVRLPAAQEVVQHTGYAPGGVCPFLLPAQLPILLDCSLRRFPTVYPAAGNDYSAVPLSVERLLELTGAREVEVCEVQAPGA
jgi:prolyl-tRNA editing enzyme YbaK/EbsC (Cys-tRNA(Pro) deacylase)